MIDSVTELKASGGDLLQPRADEVHVWCAALDVSPMQLRELEAVLAHDELLRAARFVFELDRRRFVTARAALRSVIGRYVGRDPCALRFSYTAAGKPELGEEVGRPALRFNLSHSEAFAVIGLTRGRSIGIDIEHLSRDGDYDGVAERFFSDQELRHLSSLDRRQRGRVFLEYWTKKEALLKASGQGLGLPSPDVVTASDRSGPQERGYERSYRCSIWSTRRLEPAPGYTGTVAVEGEVGRLTWFEWSPSSVRESHAR